MHKDSEESITGIYWFMWVLCKLEAISWGERADIMNTFNEGLGDA